MQNLLIATRNRHKTVELAAMLGSAFHVEDLTAYADMPEVEETGETFLENAVLKAVAVSRHVGGDRLVLADDSGLEVDALNGAPGVRSARYSGEGATDHSNLVLLLKNLEGITSRTARFRCVIAVARGGALLTSFDGACEGRIIDEPKGCEGFGYDPVFVPEGDAKTFAELPAERKNQLSHRAKAMQHALGWLRSL